MSKITAENIREVRALKGEEQAEASARMSTVTDLERRLSELDNLFTATSDAKSLLIRHNANSHVLQVIQDELHRLYAAKRRLPIEIEEAYASFTVSIQR